VPALVDSLGKDDFKTLERLYLHPHLAGTPEAGTPRLAVARGVGGLPNLRNCFGAEHVEQALQRRRA